jgi:hypothetical protein
MENFEDYSKIVEQSLEILGINPENSRCSEPGQWLIYNGETEIYVDVWEQKEPNGWNYFQPEGYNLHVFQVLAPICELPEASLRTSFYEDLLENNLNLFFASFTINKEENMLAVKFRRICNALKTEDVIEAIESVGYYAESTLGILENRYGVKKINL